MSRWYRLLKPMLLRFREKRAHAIRERFPEIETFRVLDLGGSLHFWEEVGHILKPASVTIMNIAVNGQSLGEVAGESDRARIILYDGKHIPYGDKEIDLLICNSVMEHVAPAERPALAREIGRVAKRYVIQVPALEFPIEPHQVAPFVHWLPRKAGRALSAVTLYGLVNGREGAVAMFDEVQMIGKREFGRLFPAASIVTERTFGMPKSYLAFGNAA